MLVWKYFETKEHMNKKKQKQLG